MFDVSDSIFYIFIFLSPYICSFIRKVISLQFYFQKHYLLNYKEILKKTCSGESKNIKYHHLSKDKYIDNLLIIEVACSAKKAKVDLDLEKELFDMVDSGRCDVEEDGRPIYNKLAKRTCTEWKQNSTKYNIQKHIYTRHLIPSICSGKTLAPNEF